jgi:hypothetical protein
MQSLGCGEARDRQGRLVLPLLLLLVLVLPLLVLLPCLLLVLVLTSVAMRATAPSLPPCTRPAGEREWA